MAPSSKVALSKKGLRAICSYFNQSKWPSPPFKLLGRTDRQTDRQGDYYRVPTLMCGALIKLKSFITSGQGVVLSPNWHLALCLTKM